MVFAHTYKTADKFSLSRDAVARARKPMRQADGPAHGRSRRFYAPGKEKKLFGGVGFLINGNMLVGVWKDFVIVRLGPEEGDEALLEPHVKEFGITGRSMKGWVMVGPQGLEDDQLHDWIQRAVKFVGTLPVKEPAAVPRIDLTDQSLRLFQVDKPLQECLRLRYVYLFPKTGRKQGG